MLVTESPRVVGVTNWHKNDVGMVGWPIEARSKMQTIDATAAQRNLRKTPRRRYHIEGRLLISGTDASAVPLYTRDVNMQHAGFITQTQLAAGTRAMVRLRKPTGRGITVECRVKRCREFEPGWFDCSVEFSQPQTGFNGDLA